MLYQKPKDMKYTDMCIYIDNNVYRDDLTEEEENLIYQYIFHICFMLAKKNKLFTRAHLYEDFAIHDATRIFMRYRNPKQDILKADGTPKLDRIKSVLNYAKATLYGAKVEFEQQNYSQTISYDDAVEDVAYDTTYSFSNQLSDSIDSLSIFEFEHALGDIVATIDKHLSNIPYSKDKKMMRNIRMSCLLSLLNSITLTKADEERYKHFDAKPYDHSFVLETIYINNKKNSTVLFHLDENMRGYITVLVEELRHSIARELSESLHTYIPSNNYAYIFSELNGTEYRFEHEN